MNEEKASSLSELRKWREQRRGRVEESASVMSETAQGNEEEEKDSASYTASSIGGKSDGLVNVQEIRKFNDEITQLKNRFNKQIQKERTHAAKLISSLESALGEFQKQLVSVKSLIPSFEQGPQTKEFRDSTKRISLLHSSQTYSKGGNLLAKRLLRAASDGHLEMCRDLLNNESLTIYDVNFADKEGRTPMHHLLKYIDEHSDVEQFSEDVKATLLPGVLQKMILLGANINQADAAGFSPFYLACYERENNLVRVMVEAERPMLEDARNPEITAMSLLANPNQTYPVILESQEVNWMPLWKIAVEKADEEMLSLLKQAQYRLEEQCRSIIEKQELCRRVDTDDYRSDGPKREVDFDELTKRHEKISGTWEYLMELGDPAAWTKQTNRLGSKVWDEYGSPLHLVISFARSEKDAFELMEILLQPIEDNDAEEIMTLFDPNATDKYGRTALHLACTNGYKQCIEALLKYRQHYKNQAERMADINAQENEDGLTPLMCAIKQNHPSSVDFMFERNNLMQHKTGGKEDVRVNDLTITTREHKQTALHLACAQPVEMEEVVRGLLCQNKAMVNMQDTFGFSALHLAAMNGHVMIVKCLLQYNANAAAVTKHGETALHIAAGYGYINILQVLLRNGGAEVEAENEKGKTALHHAFKRHSRLTSRLFESIQSLSEEELCESTIEEQLQNYIRVSQRRRQREQRKRIKRRGHILAEECEKMFTFDEHAQSPYKTLHQNVDSRPEAIYLAINNQDMLIKILLDAGADLEHEDQNGDPAFMLSAREVWFDVHEGAMTRIYDHPAEQGYDSEIFIDKRTQLAVQTRWIMDGLRSTALKSLSYWGAFLFALTYVALRYSGNNTYEAFSMQAGIVDRLTGDEWDEFDIKMLEQVGNTDDWHQYLTNALLPALWEDDKVFFQQKGQGGEATPVRPKSSLLNGQLALLGRPRYRQLRTRPDSCATSPSLLEQSSEACFAEMTEWTYTRVDEKYEDKTPFTCPLSNGTELLLTWENHQSYSIMGNYGFYKGGGFSVTLPSDREEALQLFHDLESCSYISLNTRVAMIEFTLYSRSLQFFTHGAVFIEMTAAGGFLSGAKFETRKLDSYTGEGFSFGIAMELVFLAMVLIYLSTELMEMTVRWEKEHVLAERTPLWWVPIIMEQKRANQKHLDDPRTFRLVYPLPQIPGCSAFALCMRRTKKPIPPYCVNPFNIVDIINLSFLITLFVIHAHITMEAHRRLPNWYDESIGDQYVDISDLLWFAVLRQHLLATILLLSYMKSLEYLQVSARLAIPVIVIGGMLMELVFFFLIFAVFILAFALSDYVLYGMAYKPTSTVIRSIVTTFRGALGDLDFDSKFELDRTFAVLMTCLSGFLLVILLLNLLIAVMNEAFDEIKGQAEARWCYMQFRMIVKNYRHIDNLSRKKNQMKDAGKAVIQAPLQSLDMALGIPSKNHAAEHKLAGENAARLARQQLLASKGGSPEAYSQYGFSPKNSSPHRHIAVAPTPKLSFASLNAGDEAFPQAEDTYDQMPTARTGEMLAPRLHTQGIQESLGFATWLSQRAASSESPRRKHHRSRSHSRKHKRSSKEGGSRKSRISPEEAQQQSK